MNDERPDLFRESVNDNDVDSEEEGYAPSVLPSYEPSVELDNPYPSRLVYDASSSDEEEIWAALDDFLGQTNLRAPWLAFRHTRKHWPWSLCMRSFLIDAWKKANEKQSSGHP